MKQPYQKKATFKEHVGSRYPYQKKTPAALISSKEIRSRISIIMDWNRHVDSLLHQILPDETAKQIDRYVVQQQWASYRAFMESHGVKYQPTLQAVHAALKTSEEIKTLRLPPLDMHSNGYTLEDKATIIIASSMVYQRSQRLIEKLPLEILTEEFSDHQIPTIAQPANTIQFHLSEEQRLYLKLRQALVKLGADE